MENLINSLTTERLAIIILIIAVIFLIIAIFRELFKMAFLIIAAVAVYALFLYFTGQKIPSSKDEAIKHGEEQLEWIKKEGGKLLKNP